MELSIKDFIFFLTYKREQSTSNSSFLSNIKDYIIYTKTFKLVTIHADDFILDGVRVKFPTSTVIKDSDIESFFSTINKIILKNKVEYFINGLH